MTHGLTILKSIPSMTAISLPLELIFRKLIFFILFSIHTSVKVFEITL